MYIENPGLEGYRQYKDRKVFVLPTTESVRGMEDALSRMAKFASKLATGADIGPAAEEDYIPRGMRFPTLVNESGVERAIDMLLNKVAGHHFTTELPVGSMETVPVPARLENLKDACIALVTTAGIVPPGNPDGLKATNNTKWGKYSIENLDSMRDIQWEVNHVGYNNAFMLENPNLGLPLDVCRELERGGAFARIYPYFYSMTGVLASAGAVQVAGKEIAEKLKAEDMDAVLLVST